MNFFVAVTDNNWLHHISTLDAPTKSTSGNPAARAPSRPCSRATCSSSRCTGPGRSRNNPARLTFIHAKRKLGSSSLSHLFAQGTVSADLLLMSREYREAVIEKIRQQEEARANDTSDDQFRGRFAIVDAEGISPRDHEVVFAIVAAWNGRSLAEALPFFSKVNLRRHVDDLTRMGYPVSVARVEVS